MSNTVGFGLTQHAEYGYQRGLGGGEGDRGEDVQDAVAATVKRAGNRWRCDVAVHAAHH